MCNQGPYPSEREKIVLGGGALLLVFVVVVFLAWALGEIVTLLG